MHIRLHRHGEQCIRQKDASVLWNLLRENIQASSHLLSGGSMLQIKNGDFAEYYEIFEELGSGQFAVVKRVKEKVTGQEWAAKIVKKKKIPTSRRGLHRADIMREAHILSMLNHPNIINLHEIYENSQEVVLILELVPGGELFDYISEKDYVSEEEAAKFILQVLEGVSHIHQYGIVHLDLKPENIMIMDKVRCTIKIIDFGISKILCENEQSKEIFGTPEFVAPEIVNFEPISTATDMWSVGVITYILLSGASPFLGDNNNETFQNINNVDFRFDEEYFGSTSDLAKDFICKLFIKDQRHRYTVVDCLNHPWIKPRRKNEEYERRKAMINMDSFKSFIARRRWKVQKHLEFKEICSFNHNDANSTLVEKSEKSEQHLSDESFSEGEELSERIDKSCGSDITEKTSKNHKRHKHRTCDNKFSTSESTKTIFPQRESNESEFSNDRFKKYTKSNSSKHFNENIQKSSQSTILDKSFASDVHDNKTTKANDADFIRDMNELRIKIDETPDDLHRFNAPFHRRMHSPAFVRCHKNRLSSASLKSEDLSRMMSPKGSSDLETSEHWSMFDNSKNFDKSQFPGYDKLTTIYKTKPIDPLVERSKIETNSDSPFFSLRGHHGHMKTPHVRSTTPQFDPSFNQRGCAAFDDFSRFSPNIIDRGFFRGNDSDNFLKSSDSFFKRHL